MKKFLLLVLTVIMILTVVGCSKNKPNDTTSPDNPNPTETTEPVPEEKVGKPVENSEYALYLTDENNKPFTQDTLPDLYTGYDFDYDGLKNKDEFKYGTDMYKVDTDGDGIGDKDEIDKTHTDPTKWSSRDDGISDLEYYMKNDQESFAEGWTVTGAHGFKAYLAKPEDRLWVMSRVDTNIFDELNTVTEVYKVINFTGQMSLNLSKYSNEITDYIVIYKIENNSPTKISSTVNENRLVIFNVQANDVIVAVYEGN